MMQHQVNLESGEMVEDIKVYQIIEQAVVVVQVFMEVEVVKTVMAVLEEEGEEVLLIALELSQQMLRKIPQQLEMVL